MIIFNIDPPILVTTDILSRISELSETKHFILVLILIRATSNVSRNDSVYNYCFDYYHTQYSTANMVE